MKNKNSITKISAGFLILTIAIFLISNVPLAEETIKGNLKTCILGKFEKGRYIHLFKCSDEPEIY